MKTSTHILGRLHFRVDYKLSDGTNAACLWVPTSEGNSDSIFIDGERFANLHSDIIDVWVAGERAGIRCLPSFMVAA